MTNAVEPQPSAVSALRTFRIGPGGLLYPLCSNVAWKAGTNNCRCRLLIPRVADGSRPAVHRVPGPACSCGFHGYSDESRLSRYRQARRLVAVIECTGTIIGGPHGVRAERAFITAIWTSRTVPLDVVAAIRARYPDAVVYRDKAVMLREHPPTKLDCYAGDGKYLDAAKRLLPTLRRRSRATRRQVRADTGLNQVGHC